MIPVTPTGKLSLGHVLAAAGVELDEVVIIRHTYSSDGISSPSAISADTIREYTAEQGPRNKLGKAPAALWLIFMADGGRRSRFYTAYENHGELTERRTSVHRYFDLRPSAALSDLADRLVIEWSKDLINWAKVGKNAQGFRVLEIADPDKVDFPGFDHVVLKYDELLSVMEDPRYGAWRTALSVVQGIYLIADTSTGKLYVGKADGVERILGRWSAYARDGHGGNIALRELSDLDLEHRKHFVFSILRVFGPSTPADEINAAESHFKETLLTRNFGLNRN